jgi:RNA polymerase sigma-70 factor (ECF subfamily)
LKWVFEAISASLRILQTSAPLEALSIPVDNSTPEGDEREWILSAKLGDRVAFDSLVELHGRAVLRYLRHMCSSEADAEDLTQEVLFQAYRRLSTFQDGTHFRSWLLTIAYHTWVHSKRRRSASEQPSDTLDTLAATPDADAAPDQGEAGEAIQASLGRLPEDQRTVVLLRFGEGLSHAEIAKITKADPATVRWRLFKARQTLRRVLASWAPGSRVTKQGGME